MTDKTKKPELIEDSDLDEASGGLLPATDSTEQKVRTTTYNIQAAWPSKIEIGALKAGDGSV